MPPVTASAPSTSDQGGMAHDPDNQANNRPTPPALDPSQSVKPPVGDEFLLKNVAAIYGPEGGAPEALRIFQINDPAQEEVPTRIEKSVPAQNLPAWVGAVIGSTTVEREKKPQ